MISSPSGFTRFSARSPGLLLYALFGRRMNAAVRLARRFFFLSTPVILRLSHWGYIDLGITFYTTAALLCAAALAGRIATL